MAFRGTTDGDGRFEIHGLPADVVVDVQLAGRIGGDFKHARHGNVQVGDADLELVLGK